MLKGVQEPGVWLVPQEMVPFLGLIQLLNKHFGHSTAELREMPSSNAYVTEEEQLLINDLSFQTSLVVQWLRICLPITGDTGSSPGPGRSHMPRSN